MAKRGGWRAHCRWITPVLHAVWLLLPLLFTFVISLDWPLPQKRAISLHRFLNPLLPVSSILVLLGFQKALSSGKTIGSPTIAILRVATGSPMRSLHCDSPYVRDGWREATATINARAQPSDVILVHPHHYAPPYNELDRLDWPTVPHWRSAEEFDEFLSDEVFPLISNCGSLCTMIVS
ncbi:MAG TPA: hypothetical protein VM075_01370 [Anaerolineae bacterium]|nr:hypothetical protein [Anaerolineae bacterium]